MDCAEAAAQSIGALQESEVDSAKVEAQYKKVNGAKQSRGAGPEAGTSVSAGTSPAVRLALEGDPVVPNVGVSGERINGDHLKELKIGPDRVESDRIPNGEGLPAVIAEMNAELKRIGLWGTITLTFAKDLTTLGQQIEGYFNKLFIGIALHV